MHDPARRRKAQRQGRERGCWVYIPAESLPGRFRESADANLYYRVWGGPGDAVIVRLYPRA